MGIWHWQVSSLRDTSRQRLIFFARSLESLLDKYEHLPFMISLHDRAVPLLHQQNVELVQQMNLWLSQAQNGTDVSQSYVLDASGTAVASSESLLLGNNYAYRPYYQRALNGQATTFYSIGTTTGLPGGFRAQPIWHDGRVIGVATIKFSLDVLEHAWIESGERLTLTDENGVVVLSSVPAWKYHAIAPLSPEALQQALRARQYPSANLPMLSGKPLVVSSEGTLLKGRDLSQRQGHWLVQSHQVRDLGWQLMLFSNLAPVHQMALLGAVGSGFATAFFMMLWLARRLRQRSLRERLAARRLLRRTVAELEQGIQMRTRQLLEANGQLQARIHDQEQAERLLRQTHDEAVQAGKLAVLGQLAAGVSHELNQPLSAIQMLAGNGRQLLALGEYGQVHENLQTVGDMATRMGSIIGPLKAFARKAPAQLQPVSLRPALDNALMLLSPMLHGVHIGIDVQSGAEDLAVQADPTRLEQVLVNLLRNAVQAVAQMPEPRVEVCATVCMDQRVLVRIRDYGQGFDSMALQHLFEPFFTTKGRGEGLGLGLFISRVIVERFGGTLHAGNANPGAWLEITLKRASS